MLIRVVSRWSGLLYPFKESANANINRQPDLSEVIDVTLTLMCSLYLAFWRHSVWPWTQCLTVVSDFHTGVWRPEESWRQRCPTTSVHLPCDWEQTFNRGRSSADCQIRTHQPRTESVSGRDVRVVSTDLKVILWHDGVGVGVMLCPHPCNKTDRRTAVLCSLVSQSVIRVCHCPLIRGDFRISCPVRVPV